jgi:serine protease
MKKLTNLLLLFATAVLMMIAACSKHDDLTGAQESVVLKEKENPAAVPQGEPISKEDVDAIIIGLLESRNDFQWQWLDLKTLWSTLQYGDNSLSIGYKPASEGDISGKLHEINIQTGDYKKVHDAIIELVLAELNKTSADPVTLDDILIEDDPILPVITLRITDRNVVTRLYNLENVRYLEPLDYWPSGADRIMSGEGCGASSTTPNTADYTTTTPNARIPWNYNNHSIPGAWNLSEGQGITVGVIDAGLSSSQSLLNGNFNNGASNVGRTISYDYTLGSSAFNSCAHGTSMSGLAVAPRNDQGAVSGVAYKSNAHFIRACYDVMLDQSAERTAVKNACVRMGDRSDIRIISMSIGSPFSYGVLKDGVDYAYARGKIIFAAAGTSFSWTSWWGVIYPAAYSSCIAVTGVKESGSKCSNCHDGSKVLYTITMERGASSNRTSLTLPVSGTNPTYIGGSSAATATAAGIASLVWSTRPNMTRAQLQSCLTNTAQFYPTRNSSKGYGNLNATAAVNYANANY